ncbi:MAG: DMT family transporter [Acidimicrobiia bacterium]|nr:DMT family transporter [Acidimicrobiia bacterium]
MLTDLEQKVDESKSRRSVGLTFATATAVISGFAVFINGYGVRAWREVASATTYTTVKNAVAAVVLVVLATALTRRGSREGLRRPKGTGQWVGVLAVAVVGGSIPFALFFEGFARATSSQAAFIHKTLVVWVVMLALIFLRERIGWLHVAAVGLLVWGQATLLGGVGGLSLGSGEVMMLGATLLWSCEVIVAKRLLSAMSPMTLAVARMAGGAVLLIGFATVSGAAVNFSALGASHVLWVLATGAVLAAYVGTWYSALARAQAVDVTAILVGGALITAALNVGVRGLAVPPVAGLALVGCGVVLAVAALWTRPKSIELG